MNTNIKKNKIQSLHTKRINDRGFSLVELIVVIGLISILSGVAVIGIKSMLPQLRLSAAARRVMTDLMQARMQAVNTNTSVAVTFASNQYTVGGVITKIPDWFKDVTLSSSSNPTFQPMGTTSSTVVVTLNGASGLPTKFVDISMAGRVKIR